MAVNAKCCYRYDKELHRGKDLIVPNRENLLFQQDVATADTARVSMAAGRNSFEKDVTSQFEDVN